MYNIKGGAILLDPLLKTRDMIKIIGYVLI